MIVSVVQLHANDRLLAICDSRAEAERYVSGWLASGKVGSPSDFRITDWPICSAPRPTWRSTRGIRARCATCNEEFTAEIREGQQPPFFCATHIQALWDDLGRPRDPDESCWGV